MKYKFFLTSLLFTLIFFASNVIADDSTPACNFSQANSSSYFVPSIPGTKVSDNLPSYEYNNRFYATPSAAAALADCLGGTVTNIPSGFSATSPFIKPDELGVKLPNGQVVNAGDAITTYIGFQVGPDKSSGSYNAWLNLINPTGGSSGSGASSGSSASSQAQAAAIKQQISGIAATLVQLYQKQLSLSSDTASNAIVTQTSGSQSNSSVTTSNSNSCPQLSSDLTLGDSGDSVVILTQRLVSEGLLTSGKSTFDQEVYDAVVAFQNKYASQILTPLGLSTGTGFVGSSTRTFINNNCSVTTSSANTGTSSDSQSGPFTYKFTKNGNMWTVTVNNPQLGNPTDHYYIPANYSITEATKDDLRAESAGRFNSSFYFPGTPDGNAFYSNMYFAFINAYYDWDNQTGQSTTTNPTTYLGSTDYLTANGAQSITVNVGDNVTYLWNSEGGTSYNSYYTASKADTCSGGFSTSDLYGSKPWYAASQSGSYSQSIQACQAGVTYTITYKIHHVTGVPDTVKTVTVNVSN